MVLKRKMLMKNISTNKLKSRSVIGKGHLVIAQGHMIENSHFMLYLPLRVLLPSIVLERPRSFNIKVEFNPYQGHINVYVKKNIFDIFSAIFYLILLQPANEVWGKVMFLHLCVILFTGGWGLPNPPWMQNPRGWADPLGSTIGL